MSAAYDDIVARLEALEGGVSLDQLPMADLQRRLESDWQPDSGVLLQPSSINKSLLASDALSAFLKLATAADRKLALGSGTLTWPAANSETLTSTVPHGLGTAPLIVLAQMGTASSSAFLTVVSRVQNLTATTFDIFAQTNDGTSPGATATVAFYWVAIA